jgi:hypothetical protein
MKRTFTLAAITLLATTFTTIPTAMADGPGWTVKSTVIRIVNTSNGGFNVRLSPDLTNCVSQSGYGPSYASVLPNHPGLNRIKADLLVAFLTGTQVSLYLGDSSCNVGETALESY